MNFRDVNQRARTCRALLTCGFEGVRVPDFWTEKGPTTLAGTFLEFGPGKLTAGEWEAMKLALDVWIVDGIACFDISTAIRDWKPDGWRVFATFADALVSQGVTEAALTQRMEPMEPAPLDAWIAQVERRHGWTAVPVNYDPEDKPERSW